MKHNTKVTPLKATDEKNLFNLRIKTYKGVLYDENHTESELREMIEVIDNGIGTQPR